MALGFRKVYNKRFCTGINKHKFLRKVFSDKRQRYFVNPVGLMKPHPTDFCRHCGKTRKEIMKEI